MALDAEHRQVMTLILRRGITVALIGIAVGIAATRVDPVVAFASIKGNYGPAATV